MGLLLFIRAGDTYFPVSVGGDVVANKHVSVTRRVGFVDDVVRHFYDADSVVSVNTGGHTSLSGGVAMNDTVVADTDVSVVHKRIAFVSGDVRVADRNLPDHAGGDTCFPVRVNEGDPVGVHTSGGVATPVDVDGCSVVPPVVDLPCDVDHVLSADAAPSGGGG